MNNSPRQSDDIQPKQPWKTSSQHIDEIRNDINIDRLNQLQDDEYSDEYQGLSDNWESTSDDYRGFLMSME